MYNRLNVASVCRDSTDSWTYATTTIRAANNNNANRITAVFGLDEDAVSVTYQILAKDTAGLGTQESSIFIGRDSTSAFVAGSAPGAVRSYSGSGTAVPATTSAYYSGYAGLGRHFFQALEWASGSTATFYGDNGTQCNHIVITTRITFHAN